MDRESENFSRFISGHVLRQIKGNSSGGAINRVNTAVPEATVLIGFVYDYKYISDYESRY
jgi:hypothetical protein